MCEHIGYNVRQSIKKGTDVKNPAREAILVTAIWDAEAHVFVASSDQVPGLVAEASTLDELGVKLAARIPELLELNEDCLSGYSDESEIPMKITSEWNSMVRVPA